MNLADIETIIILLMENRSFDHILGYLSLPDYGRNDVEGLKDGVLHSNSHDNKVYASFKLTSQILEDPPHERGPIATQLSTEIGTTGEFKMDGFVESYAGRDPAPKDLSQVMGYHTAEDVPMYHFLAQHFAICDHWFASLPTGTQPNRLMAMSGESAIEVNAHLLLPEQKLVYDWLNERNIQWSAYNYGHFPFFALMHKWQFPILTDLACPHVKHHRHFKRYNEFKRDWQSDKALPPVLFFEPEYTDVLNSHPNDDHPPTGVDKGQAFVKSIYETLISNPKRWAKTAWIITYDEHGGCYDHVSPPKVSAEAPSGFTYPSFASTGVRVPAFIVSPWVEPGSVYKKPMDHTTLLHFLAERFDRQGSYSPEVEERQQHFGKISDILSLSQPRTDLPVPPTVEIKPVMQTSPQTLDGASANTQAFERAKDIMATEHPELWVDYKKICDESAHRQEAIMKAHPNLWPDMQ